MKIHAISLDHVRAIDHLELADIPDTGFILIAGPNEQGKSTVMEAVHVVLFHKHTSGSKDIKALQPVGQDVGSTITLEATIGDWRFEITKTFNRQKSAQLRIIEPRVENHTGAEAERVLAEIIDASVDKELFKALFVRQGELGTTLNAAGIPTLNDALGGATRNHAAADNSELIQRIDTEYRRYFTAGKGQPSGELKQALDDAAAAEEAYVAAEREVRELSGFVEHIAQLEEDHRTAVARIPSLKCEIHSREQELARAAATQQQLRDATQAVELAEAKLAHALKEWQEREKLSTEIEETTARMSTLEAALAEKTTERDAHDRRVAHSAEVLQQARKQLEKHADIVDESAAALKACDAAIRLRELRALEVTVADFEQRIREIEEIEHTQITAAEVSAAEAAEKELLLATARLEAQSTRLELRADDPVTVTIDGHSIEVSENSHSLSIVDTTTLVVAGVDITVVPAGSQHNAQQAVEDAQRTLQAALAVHECGSVEELKTRFGQQQEREAERTALRAQRKAALQGRGIEQVRTELEKLQDQADQSEPTEDRHELEKAYEQAVEKHKKSKQAVEVAAAELDSARSFEIAAEVKFLESQLRSEGQRRDKTRAAREAAREAADDTALHGAVDTATGQRDAAKQRKLEAEQRAREADYDAAERLLRGARQALDDTEAEVLAARTGIAENRGRVEQSSGAAERRDVAAAALTAAQATLEAVRRRAEAVRLLREVVLEHRDRAQRRYAAPFAEKLSTYARLLFGSGVSFELGDKLQVTRRVRGTEALDVAWLSGGAQEQLALLTRLAVADLVAAGQGVVVPVFVDDVLGNTDSSRLAAMAAVLSEVSREKQVFVLSCAPERYMRVENKKKYEVNLIKRSM